jgi:hypothetical protein
VGIGALPLFYAEHCREQGSGLWHIAVVVVFYGDAGINVTAVEFIFILVYGGRDTATFGTCAGMVFGIFCVGSCVGRAQGVTIFVSVFVSDVLFGGDGLG